MRRDGWFGYHGIWAFVDLTDRTVRIEPASAELCRQYIGGRGVQARLVAQQVLGRAPLDNPLSPSNRLVVGSGPLNDVPIATAGRGSCSFISPLTCSAQPAPWIPGHTPVHGLLTHSSAGGVFPNMLKRAGIDQLVIDGCADRPVRLVVTEEAIRIVDAEADLFNQVGGMRSLRAASQVADYLAARHPGGATVSTGPAGWNLVPYACLTNDRHRNFGRGGAGAIFGSKNLVAITAQGRQAAAVNDPSAFDRHAGEVDAVVRGRTTDAQRTASLRPATGTTWWLDRAFDGRYMGSVGGYLPWHNFDEGSFEASDFACVGTGAFLEISGKHHVCNRCRHVMCTRAARIESGRFAGEGVRPEFETIALWINCGLLDRAAIFHLNQRCNDLGIDTMTFGSVLSAAMELAERGLLDRWAGAPAYGNTGDAVAVLEAIAYRSNEVGELLATTGDGLIARVTAARGASDAEAIVGCVTTAFGGLGYAGIEPKVFPGMFAAYATSNRGRGDHTYAWTVQAEESGLREPRQLAAYVAESQVGKALIDSLGLCDFFPGDVTSDEFLGLYRALTGVNYTADALLECGRRIYALERYVNNGQGRARAYDEYVHPKLQVPLTVGPQRGRAVDPREHAAILDAYYAYNGWSSHGTVGAARLQELGIELP